MLIEQVVLIEQAKSDAVAEKPTKAPGPLNTEKTKIKKLVIPVVTNVQEKLKLLDVQYKKAYDSVTDKDVLTDWNIPSTLELVKTWADEITRLLKKVTGAKCSNIAEACKDLSKEFVKEDEIVAALAADKKVLFDFKLEQQKANKR